jgi:hypothetical protein
MDVSRFKKSLGIALTASLAFLALRVIMVTVAVIRVILAWRMMVLSLIIIMTV